jgi:hypothetical protein
LRNRGENREAGDAARWRRRILTAAVFERLWEETGCAAVIADLAGKRGHNSRWSGRVFLTVLHRLFVSGSDRAADRWREDYVTVGRPAHGQAPRGECVSNIVSYTAHQPSKHSLLTEFVAATVEGPFFDPAR